MYIDIVTGVYRQNILGVFNDRKEAIQVGKQWLDKQRDDYHEVIIYNIETEKVYDDIEDVAFTIKSHFTKYNRTYIVLDNKGKIWETYVKENSR